MSLTAEQLDARKHFIGGSDAPVVVGLSPFKTPFQLWCEKRGLAMDEEETEEMYWGNRLEDVIVDAWMEKTGHQARRHPTRTSKEYPFMGVNVDRQIIGHKRGPGYLEVKNFGYWSTGYDRDEETVNDYVQAQIQHGLAVTGWNWGSYAVLVGGNRFYHGEIERDQEVIDLLIDAETQFWNMVQSDTQPEVDGTARTTEFIKRLYPINPHDVVIVDDPHHRQLYQELGVVRAQLKELGEKKEQLNNAFKLVMKDHSILRIPGLGECSWKCTKKSKKTIFLESEFEAAHPDLYRQFTKQIETGGERRFLFQDGKDSSTGKKKKGRS